ncbi:hypothetical protein MXB_5699, partial [Myxobolus squamalis]
TGIYWELEFNGILKNIFTDSISLGYYTHGAYYLVIIMCVIYGVTSHNKGFIYLGLFFQIFVFGCSIGELIYLVLGYFPTKSHIQQTLSYFEKDFQKNLKIIEEIQLKVIYLLDVPV